MKLSNIKNVTLCSKALYAEQLKCYAALCKCYKDLSKHVGFNATARDVQRKYSNYLTLAAKGDLSFTEKSENQIYSANYRGARFSDDEIAIFEEYAKQASLLSQFKKGAELLDKSIQEDDYISPSKIDDFRDYMQDTSRATRKFDREIFEHSKTYIGHSYYVMSRRAIRDIENIDPSHMQDINIAGHLKPEQFGSSITGVKSIQRLGQQIMDTLEDASYVDTPEERAEYKKSPRVISELGYKFVAKNQKGIAISLATIMALGAVTGIGFQAKEAFDYGRLNIETFAKQGYDTELSKETLQSIESLSQVLEDAKNQGTIPTKDQLMDIGSNIDDLFDQILQEKIEPSFLQAHPDAKEVTVDHQYNETTSDGLVKSVFINYKNADGISQTERISHFSSEGIFTPDDIDKMFDHEYNIDKTYGEIGSIFSANGVQNYEDNAEDVTKILNKFGKNLDFLKHFAALKINYKDGILYNSLKTTFPDKQEEKTSPNTNETSNNKIIDDDERA